MRDNVIVMTVGLTGSSVLTGMLGGAGYWTGDATVRKPDYDTYENQELVELNRDLLDRAGYRGEFTMEFSEQELQRIARASRDMDLGAQRAFVERCNARQPWIWKDPRLWLTVRCWQPLLDWQRIRLILLTREENQSWISATLRRQIQTRAYGRRYARGVQRSIEAFAAEVDRPLFHLVYEDLILRPEQTLARLNAFLGAALTLVDLTRVYRGRLYRRQRGWRDLSLAYLIYLKNYSIRYR